MANLEVGELAPLSGSEAGDVEARVARAVEPQDGMADCLAHALDLVLSSLVDRQLDPRGAQPTDLRGGGAAVVQVDALGKLPERFRARLPLDVRLVRLVHLVARVGEAMGELAVVRQEKRPRRVDVEAADGDEPRTMLDEIYDGRTSLWVPRGRHDPGRLVQEHVGELLRRDAAPVDLDHIPPPDEVVQLAAAAVDRDAPGLDQLVRAAARGHAGAGEVGIQSHGRSLFAPLMPHYISLMRWTSKGMAGLPGWRERVDDGERIIEEAGGTLIGVWVTLGRYDVVEIFDAPDDETAAEILMKLQVHGAEHTETLRGFTREEAEAIVRKL
jgi:uncharacterized protein with GYD domain